MPGTFSLFWKLCLLRGGPEQVPYSSRLTLGVLAAWLAAALPLALAIPGLESGRALTFVLCTLAVEWLGVSLLLRWRNHGARLLQTMTALLGADLLLNLMSWPLVLPFAGEQTSAAVYAAVAQLLLFGWSVAVKGHILRAALDVPRAVGVLAALLLVLLNMMVAGLLFPDLAVAAAQTD